MSSTKSHSDFLDSIVRSAERLCEGELHRLRHRSKVSAFCLLHKTYHRVDHPINGHVYHFVTRILLSFSCSRRAGIGNSALQNRSIQSVVSACCWPPVELVAVGPV